MDGRAYRVLVLGDLPEVRDIFSREIFRENTPVTPIQVKDHDGFEEALNADEVYSLILMDVMPYGLEVLEQVHKFRPACPVIMIGDVSQASLILEALRRGLEGYVLRTDGSVAELFIDLLAEEIFAKLMRYVEPPTMASPSADEIYRYAQYHNVKEPFFVVAPKRYLLYFNQAGRNLIESVHGRVVRAGEPVETWWLEPTAEKFRATITEVFAGYETVHEHRFEALPEPGLRELYYQPVIDPTGRTIAVSISVHQPARPELQRAWFMHKTAELLAWVGHENNNLLNILMSNADLLSMRLAELGDEEALSRMQAIESAIERAIRSTQQMQAFSSTGVIQPERLELNGLIDAMLEVMRGELASNIELVFRPADKHLEIYSDRRNWETVVSTLVRNGAEEMPGGGRIQLQTRSIINSPSRVGLPVGPGSYVLLEIVFDGRVMADWLQDRRFDPFFTLRKNPGYGGLELATVKNIIEQGGGKITLRDTGQRTAVQIYFPVAGETES